MKVSTLTKFAGITITALLLAVGVTIADPAPISQMPPSSDSNAETEVVTDTVATTSVDQESDIEQIAETTDEAAVVEHTPATTVSESASGEHATEVEVVAEPEPAPDPTTPEPPLVEVTVQSEPELAPAPEPTAVEEQALTAQANVTAEPKQPAAKAPSKFKMSFGVGGTFAANFGGGVAWVDPPVELLEMPYMGGGGYLFLDVTYAEIFVGYYTGGGKWESPNASDSRTLPELSRSFVNLGLLAKLPIETGSVTLFPLLGIEYDVPVSGELKFASGLVGETDVEVSDLAALWVKFGAGIDVGLSGNAYIRLSALYGFRTSNALEENYVKAVKNNLGHNDAETNTGHGVAVRVGVGFKF